VTLNESRDKPEEQLEPLKLDEVSKPANPDEENKPANLDEEPKPVNQDEVSKPNFGSINYAACGRTVILDGDNTESIKTGKEINSLNNTNSGTNYLKILI
jgi:hypothetical protein